MCIFEYSYSFPIIASEIFSEKAGAPKKSKIKKTFL